jgi:hypothetical protein
MSQSKLVLVKGRAGLGNRMLSAVTGLVYARLSGRRLLVDWSDGVYTDDRSNVFDRFFRCSSCVLGERIPTTDSVAPDIWRGNLQRSALEIQHSHGIPNNRDSWRPMSVNLKRLDYREEIVVMWMYSQQISVIRKKHPDAFSDFGRVHVRDILRKLLRDDLILHPEIQERVNRFKRDHFRSPTVGVHVRYSDRQADLSGIRKQLNKLLRRESGLQIFLATDNVQVKELFERKYAEVVTTPHWYPAAGTSAHQNGDCPDRLENGVEALVDLYLLAACEYLVIDTTSSFSKIAGLLSSAPRSKIVDLKAARARSDAKTRQDHPREAGASS